MSQYKPVKKSTFLEAVAACVQHEKEVFEFYERNSESLPAGPIKDLFIQLAEDVDEHLKMISDLYSEIQGGDALPNLKMASQVQKFNSTSIQILMRRLDRNLKADAKGDELQALTLATREHEDAAEFYSKMGERFEDPGARSLFQQLAHFQTESKLLLESFSTYLSQGTPYSQPSAYWEMEEAN